MILYAKDEKVDSFLAGARDLYTVPRLPFSWVQKNFRSSKGSGVGNDFLEDCIIISTEVVFEVHHGQRVILNSKSPLNPSSQAALELVAFGGDRCIQ